MKYVVTDIIGQPHVFNVGGETVRLYSRKSVEIEAPSLPRDIELEEKRGFVMVEEKASVKRNNSKTTNAEVNV